MNLSGISPVLLLASLMVASTPILLAALGELVAERSGVLNLGVEGMMITGAITGFAVAVATGSPWIGFVGAAAGGAALSLLFAVLVLWLRSNQVATGLALTLFGIGLAALVGQAYVGVRAPVFARLDLPVLGDLPILGPILFRHDAVVYLGLGLVAGVWWFLHRTRAGLRLRAVGENHDAAHALGYKVQLIRLGAVLFGGALAGLGGAYLSLVRVPQWTQGVTAGAGWIALAIVVFASWRPWRLLLGAWLFGGISVLQLNLQAARVPIPVEVLSMAPYVVTILVLVLISSGRGRAALAAPGSLGQPFHAAR
ncbi:nucleoside ABC transporter membrane protein [Rubellimicrobium thermophilum DSM 16684]|uniref:Nucleoside ABC transporter membrane protein n=1 Tax=Rubellimicrobium thermophilum DSM 16684 TaxID=1123069 RepID=S9QYB7_9RHOB|nr:ABC transporter permease [Rubellimicrobium thermophilum]EPX86391.1 nucleoside ABC transporter membrane protein [Rubellimicrobium thermophilum DSM 16684]